ncbi:MAG: hypothetical protein KAG95_04385 [Bacteroidales bacterium]|nr:hypothetical protein [Bacteroidales bacterium]
MKTKTLLISFIFLLFTFIVNAQENNDAYDYPVKSGTNEWKQFKDTYEMIKACQVPEDILKNMSTEGLVITCLNHPLYGSIFASENLQDGFESFVGHFNCFKELLKRQDAGKNLMKIYKKMETNNYANNKNKVINDGKFRFTFIELFLSQEKILNTMKKEEQKELVKETLLKINKKHENGNYSIYNQATSVLIIIRVLKNNNYDFSDINSSKREEVEIFNKKIKFYKKETLDIIIDKANYFINQ